MNTEVLEKLQMLNKWLCFLSPHLFNKYLLSIHSMPAHGNYAEQDRPPQILFLQDFSSFSDLRNAKQERYNLKQGGPETNIWVKIKAVRKQVLQTSRRKEALIARAVWEKEKLIDDARKIMEGKWADYRGPRGSLLGFGLLLTMRWEALEMMNLESPALTYILRRSIMIRTDPRGARMEVGT